MRGKLAAVSLLLLVGLGILLYPLINNRYTHRQMENRSEAFLATTEVPMPELPEAATEPTIPHEELLNAMQEYNRELFASGQAGLDSAAATEESAFLLSGFFGVGDMFGVLSIPAIDLRMPLYLGATDLHMAEGAAQLGHTSLPIGGEDTNCVIAGHRGYNGADYFRYVPELAIGNEVQITNVWETLTYRVTEKKIISPDDIPAIQIQPSRDLLMLLTCHPYASGGRQRYLVICERVEE